MLSKRVEKQLAEMTAKENAKRLEVLALQQKIQQTAAGVAGAQEASA